MGLSQAAGLLYLGGRRASTSRRLSPACGAFASPMHRNQKPEPAACFEVVMASRLSHSRNPMTQVTHGCRIWVTLPMGFRATHMPDDGRSIAMSAEVRRPIGSRFFVFALLGSSLGINLPTMPASAADCLAAPNLSGPANGHWYYRIDRSNQRKCWHLGEQNVASHTTVLQTAHETAVSKQMRTAPAGKPAVNQRKSRLSDKEVAQLYAEFVEWRRHFGRAE